MLGCSERSRLIRKQVNAEQISTALVSSEYAFIDLEIKLQPCPTYTNKQENYLEKPGINPK
jgi:hypothetical protein